MEEQSFLKNSGEGHRKQTFCCQGKGFLCMHTYMCMHVCVFAVIRSARLQRSIQTCLQVQGKDLVETERQTIS